ncbi:hypothetical protein [Streptomyces sp. SID2119]|uniref:hypothetical protein n=1 Tax=Streptomyces sp. SID2119 TaxID=2690253 RepID=UPI001367CE77|nr:hypothetical protein [Streptomyces sp. SID2119]MYW34822.1 hypothetical protein [Streptomyces sp. SID2119]
MLAGSRHETTVWAVQPVDVRRPSTGVRTAEMVCDSCGDVIEVRVSSAEIARRHRMRWLALTIAELSLTALAAAMTIRSVEADFSSRSTGGLGPQTYFWTLTTSLLTAGGSLLFRQWKREDGVRGPGDDWRTFLYRGRSSNQHNLLPPV